MLDYDYKENVLSSHTAVFDGKNIKQLEHIYLLINIWHTFCAHNNYRITRIVSDVKKWMKYLRWCYSFTQSRQKPYERIMTTLIKLS
jgi:hypothetical protein